MKVHDGAVADNQLDDVTEDAFLGGRVRLLQPRKGYRAGLDAVFLAASIPCRPGERVLEAGMGVGAAALCLTARVAGAHVTGIELSPLYAALAGQNIRRNAVEDRVKVIIGDVREITRSKNGWAPAPGAFDHVYANPPYHIRERVSASPTPHKTAAHSMGEGELEIWLKMMAAMAKPRGTITIVQNAEHLPMLLAAFGTRAGDLRIVPLFPRAGVAASLVLVQGVKGSRAAARLLPGLTLHHPHSHQFTQEAEEVLRHGAPFPLR